MCRCHLRQYRLDLVLGYRQQYIIPTISTLCVPLLIPFIQDSKTIRTAQETFAKCEIKSELAYIKNNFALIIRRLKTMETQGLELNESVEIEDVVMAKMEGLQRKEFPKKIVDFHRNVGFKTVQDIRNVLYKGNTSDIECVNKLTSAEFAPMTSIDVERSFSSYKLVFSERRKSFLFEDLRKHVIVKCNRLLSLEEDDE